MPELQTHLDKLKAMYHRLNPNKETKEIAYLVNLGKVINQLEQAISKKDDLLL